MHKKVAVGVIGTGVIAREHARAITMVGNRATLVAAADIAPSRVQEFCKEFPVARQYNNADDLIADHDIDLVVITTPPAAHEASAVAALEHGKYVLCEKPLAHTLASAARIAEAEARHPGRLAVSYQMRYESSFRRLIWLCHNDSIGEIRSATIERHSYIPPSANGAERWWGAWNIAGGGVLITQLIHELDVLLLVMGPPIAVVAEMDTRYVDIESEDHVVATILFSGGRSARCMASVNSGRIDGHFTIQGSSGSVGLPWNLSTNDPRRPEDITKAVDKALPETRPQSRSILSRGMRFVTRCIGVRQSVELTPHARLYAELVRSIQRRAPLPVPPADALQSLELCMAAYESALAGGVEVRLPLNPASTIYGGVSKAAYDSRGRRQQYRQ